MMRSVPAAALVAFGLLAAAPAAPVLAQRPAASAAISAPIRDVRYTLAFTRASAAEREVGVTMAFSVAGPAPVLLSLPAWTPGAYEIVEFAKHVRGFEARQGGAALAWDKTDPRTWRVRPTAAGEVTIRFRARADTLDNGQAWSRPDFLLVNGTTVFLYPQGQPFSSAAAVTVETEADWLVATGMTATGPRRFTAPNYHDLVDMPFMIGKFDLDSVPQGPLTVRFATYPAGSVTGDVRATTLQAIAKMFAPMERVFGELPFRHYTVMQIADSSYGGASGLEHQNSHVDVITPLAIGNPFLNGLYAHEIFHAWNVKRLRPADLFPYRYDAVQATPWLWVSEGITDYYADLVLLRAGLTDSSQFLATTQGKIQEVDEAPPVALEDASLSTWVHPDDGTGYLYYPKGSLAGLLLDIEIRAASNNASSLDQVMRTVYERTWKQGRGFTAEDWWSTVRAAAGGRSFETFNRRYIDGREPFPYAEVLAKAGLRYVADTTREGRLGVSSRAEANGVVVVDVLPTSTAEAAGVRSGDKLLEVGGIAVTDPGFGAQWRQKYGTTEGTPVTIVVERNGQRMTLATTTRKATIVTRVLAPDPAASPAAQAVRAGLFRGTTTGER